MVNEPNELVMSEVEASDGGVAGQLDTNHENGSER